MIPIFITINPQLISIVLTNSSSNYAKLVIDNLVKNVSCRLSMLYASIDIFNKKKGEFYNTALLRGAYKEKSRYINLNLFISASGIYHTNTSWDNTAILACSNSSIHSLTKHLQ